MRGDVYAVRDPRPAKGHEQRGRRYAVVVQSAAVTLSTAVAAPTSAGSWDAPFHPEIELMGRRTRVLVDQMQVVDIEQRFDRKVGRVSHDEQDEIDEAMKLVLGLW